MVCIKNLLFTICGRTQIFSVSLLVLLLYCPTTSAGSYNVKAAVPFPAPTHAALIDSSLANSTVHDALLGISGSCELLNPKGMVSIWRDGSAIGSAPCDGTFSLQVMLYDGQNDLIARSASASGQYGPDGAITKVTLVLPAQPPAAKPTSTATTENTIGNNNTPAEQTASNNTAAASQLTALPINTFTTMGETNATSVDVVVKGGSSPYTVMLNWGDGTVESHMVSTPGTYRYSHSFEKNGSYKVHGMVRDVLGASTVFDYAVLTSFKSPALSNPSGKANTGSNHYNVSLVVAVTVIGLLVGGFSYIFGIRHAEKVYDRRNRKRKLAAKKAIKRKRRA